MGIYTRRGLEYLVIFKKNPEITPENLKLLITSKFKDTLPQLELTYIQVLNALSIIGQDQTDDRLIHTQYYKENESRWFHNASYTCEHLHVESIPDFIPTEQEAELIKYIESLSILASSIQHHGWHDVNHVSTTY